MGAARYPAPIKEDFRDLLAELLGRPVVSEPLAPPEPFASQDDDEEEARTVVAEYVTDDGSVGALCVVEVPLAAHCGAALSMVPASVADEAARRPELPGELLENWKEVANIFAQLLNGPRTPHLRLQGLHQLPGDLPAPVGDLLAAPAFRRDFELSVEDYGKGRFTLLVA